MNKFDRTAGTDKASSAEPLPVESEMEVTTQVELQFTYNVNNDLVIPFGGNGGAVSHADSSAVLSTGTNSEGFALFVSRKVAQHHAGKKSIYEFDASFDGGQPNSSMVIGGGNTTNGLFFGYVNEDFGVIRRTGGDSTVMCRSVAPLSTMVWSRR